MESVPRAHYDTDNTITRGIFSNAVSSHQTGVLFSADHLCIWLGVRFGFFQFKHLSCILSMGPATDPRREGGEGRGYQPMSSPPPDCGTSQTNISHLCGYITAQMMPPSPPSQPQ